MTVKAVIFDLDGTLLNTLGDLTKAVNYSLEPYGIVKSEAEVRRWIGKGVKNLVTRVLEDSLGTISETELDKCFNRFIDYYQEHLNEESRPYDGIIEMLQWLKERDIYVGVISNKFHEGVVQLVDHFFCGLVDNASGLQEGDLPKPDPTNLLLMMSSFGVVLDECLYVGDSDVDFITAVRANIDNVIVAWGYETKEKVRMLKKMSEDKLNGFTFVADDIESLKGYIDYRMKKEVHDA